MSGTCGSFLVSLKEQEVSIGKNGTFNFEKNEIMYMEPSQKYAIEETDEIAGSTGFEPVAHFFDKGNGLLMWYGVCVNVEVH